MGFLQIFGKALEWEESKIYLNTIRENALITIIDWIHQTKGKKCNPKFGYEMEFHKIYIDDAQKEVLIDLKGEHDIKNFILKNEKISNEDYFMQFEFGKWMIEVVPSKPFKSENPLEYIYSIENVFKFMRDQVGDKSFISISTFPLLGAQVDYIKLDDEEYIEVNGNLKEGNEEHEKITFKKVPYNSKELIENNVFSQSKFTNDIIINSHPRFGCLARNIRLRRGKKVEILVPLYIDKNTNLNKTDDEPFPGYIYMDSMAFGMGNACFQITLGSCSLNSACYLYDQLIPLTPILLAITGSSPIFKGKLSAYDARFNVISMAVDDRTDEERDVNSTNYIYKSRYSSVYSYISQHEYIQDFHNNYPQMPIDKQAYLKLIEQEIPERLAIHICNLLVRDPLVIFNKKLNLNDLSDRSHFENFNSTNWNSLRFKPPKIEDNDCCFKIEVRPCELQLTAIENTAIMTFCLIYSQMIIKHDLNFIIPISLVDQNFERAHNYNAIEFQKFYFRIDSLKNYKKESKLTDNKFLSHGNKIPDEYFVKDSNLQAIKELSIQEIFLGSDKHSFEGLFPIMYDFIEHNFVKEEFKIMFIHHLKFLENRVTCKFWTDAKYIRNFVINHPQYKKDSIVTQEINYDLINHLCDIQNKKIFPKELFGEFFS